MLVWRGLVFTIGILVLWQCIVIVFHLPPYILPSPTAVFSAWINNADLILQETWPTVVETLLGLVLGSFIGIASALAMTLFQPVRFWLMPMLIISQALPTFVIAPLLVIWFGYGLASKIITTMVMLFFPITSAFFDGLRRTNPGWLDMVVITGASRWRALWCIRVPAALPALASGLRVAVVFAPIGAIVGEWVGSSRGLGFLMLNANARMQIDLMFACLITIILMALSLYFIVDKALRFAIPWQAEK
jgi:putative hydroxymethylpyrimidine transport system permease protein